MLFPSQAHAHQFRVPGQELWGIWKLVRHEFGFLGYQLDEKTSKELDGNMGYLPVGQILEINGDGLQIFRPSQDGDGPYEIYPMVTMKFRAPFSKSVCSNKKWFSLCPTEEDHSSALNTDYEERAYVRFRIGTNIPQEHRSFFSDTSAIDYDLSMEGGGSMFLTRVGENMMVEQMSINARPEQDKAAWAYMVWKKIGELPHSG